MEVISMENLPTLPPRLSGVSKGHLRLVLSSFQNYTKRQLNTNFGKINILWWGYDNIQNIKIPLQDDLIEVHYNIITTKSFFRQYLKDAEKLFFEITFYEERYGFAMIDKLESLLDTTCLRRTLEIFDDNGQPVGEISCCIQYDENKENICSNRSPSPAKSPKMKDHRPTMRKVFPSRSDVKVLSSSKSSGKVTFSDTETDQKEKSNNSHKNLNKVILRSKARLESFAKLSDNKEKMIEKINDINTDSEDTKEKTPEKTGFQLPSWNLSTSRLHFISTVTQVVVEVSSIKFNAKFFNELIKNPNFKAQLNQPLSYQRKDPLSFFVSFIIPPSSLSTNFCSRKYSKEGKILFNQKFVQPLTFKPDLLDTWWTSNCEIKILSRTMKQRMSTLIGQASVGLKHLLSSTNNSDGSTLKLSIYASQKTAKEYKLKSEIIGDVFISFLLNSTVRANQKPSQRDVSPQAPVRDTDGEEIFATSSSEDAAPEIVSIDKSEIETHTNGNPTSEETPITNLEIEKLSTSDDTIYRPSTNKSYEGYVFCLLKVTRGRNFTKDCAKSKNLYISCRFLTSSNTIKSQTIWNSTQPQFNMIHYVPIEIDDEFLSRCKDNYLAIEVWNYQNKNENIGVAMVPLHQFYISFKNANRTIASLNAEFPVIAINNWIPVRNLSNEKEEGQIKVSLIAGTDKQIRSFVPEFKGSEDSDVNVYDSVYCDSSDSNDKVITTETTKSSKEKPINEMKAKIDESNVTFTPKSPVPPQKKDSFVAEIIIEEARNIPLVFNNENHEKFQPSTYVTYGTENDRTKFSEIINNSANPRWNFKNLVKIGKTFFSDPKRYFIIKVWHHASKSGLPDIKKDDVLGFVALDLRPLAAGIPTISGWYNIMDFIGKCKGQMKITVSPKQKIASQITWRRDSEIWNYNSCAQCPNYQVKGSYENFPSHVVQHTEQIISPCLEDIVSNDSENLTAQTVLEKTEDNHSIPSLMVDQMTSLPQEACTPSFLAAKLNSMELNTQKLKAQLESNNHQSNSEEINIIESLDNLTNDLRTKLSYLGRTESLCESDPLPSNSESIDLFNFLDDNNPEANDEIMQPFLNEIRPSTLEDLGSIDWNNVFAEDDNRLRPEGGSSMAAHQNDYSTNE